MKITFKGNPVELHGTEITVGRKAPDFNAVKNDLSAFSLAGVAGRKLIVSVPSIDTPVCDAEVRRFNKEAASIDGVTIIVVSMDLPFAQARWCGAADIDKVMTISDYKERNFAMKYGVYMPELGLLARAVFLLDEDNTILYSEYVSEVTDQPNFEAILEAIKKA